MKIVKEEDQIIVVTRNKRRGVRLKVEKGSRITVPCDKCDLNIYKNSLCTDRSALCDLTKFEGLLDGNLYFKIA